MFNVTLSCHFVCGTNVISHIGQVHMQIGKIWKEIVLNKDGEKNEVVNDTFNVVIEGKGCV